LDIAQQPRNAAIAPQGKEKPMKRVSRLSLGFAVAVVLLAVGSMAVAVDDFAQRGQLTSQIDYRFVGHLQQWDLEGRLLVWQGSIVGDFTGEMKWWFEIPSPVSGGPFEGGRVSFYSARWEIWDGDELLLAGESAGKTVFPDGADGMWDGHGVVTEAAEGLNPLKGRKVYETGPVVVGELPPLTFSGTGMFLMY
jgi:hypothetical protein